MVKRGGVLARQPEIAVLRREKCQKIAGDQRVRWWIGQWFESRAIKNLELSRPCRSILGEQALDTKPAIFQKTEHLMARPAFGWRGKTFPARIELEQLAICLDNDVAIFEWKQGSGRLQLTRVEGGERIFAFDILFDGEEGIAGNEPKP